MHSQRNHQQNEKTINRMGENIYKWSDWQRIHHQNIQTAHTAQYQNTNTNLKMGGSPDKTFFQITHTDDQQAHEKMFNIANHQRNGNQNHNAISSYICQNGYYQ